MQILYRDNHVIGVEKPAGILTQDSGTNLLNLEDQLREWVKKEYAKPGRVFVYAIHRLDRPASGVVLFAKTGKALTRLNASMRAGRTHKVYYAIVYGTLVAGEDSIENYVVHREHFAAIAKADQPGAKLARLSYQVIKEEKGYSLVRIVLHTGRYHQIRLQMAYLGHPILGDIRYGGKFWRSGEIALHHAHFSIDHPVNGGKIEVESKIPSDWPTIG